LKQAVGVARATGEVVAFLDDDDLWEVEKVQRTRQRFAERPTLVYFDHAQTAIDANGAPVRARHAEYAGRRPEEFGKPGSRKPWTLFDRIWPGNGSSTSVRRAWAAEWVPSLREVQWSADVFWFAAALLGEGEIALSAEPLTRLRLHAANTSNTRGVSPEDFRIRHAESSSRFAASYGALARLSAQRRGPGSPIARYFAQNAEAFRFQADLEAGHRPRAAAARMLRRGPGRKRTGLLGVALVALFSPGLGRRLLYRASDRRFRLG
jgi:hypothetical protein